MHLEINDAKISDIDGSNIWQSAQKAYLHTSSRVQPFGFKIKMLFRGIRNYIKK